MFMSIDLICLKILTRFTLPLVTNLLVFDLNITINVPKEYVMVFIIYIFHLKIISLKIKINIVFMMMKW